MTRDDFIACADCEATVQLTDPEVASWRLDIAGGFKAYCNECARERGLLEPEAEGPVAAAA